MDRDAYVILALFFTVFFLVLIIIILGVENDKLRVKIDYAKEFTGCEEKKE